MKKTFTLLSALVLATGSLFAETTVVYLNDNGSMENDGLTPETAVSSLTVAFDKIPVENDGIIVLNGKFTQSTNFVPTIARSGKMTFTQVYNGVDYRATDHNATAWTLSKGVRLGLATDTKFENVTFNQMASKTPNLLLVCNFHEVTIGKGCEMNGTFVGEQIGNSFTILGGCQDNDNLAPAVMDSKINVESGNGLIIVAYNRGTAKNFKRNDEIPQSHATINVSGGQINNIYTGYVAAGLKNGNASINISGGSFPLKRVLNFHSLDREPGTKVELNVCGMPLADQYNLLEYTQTMHFDRVTADVLVPEKVFESGKYTLEDGTEVNYRYHIPDFKPEATKHLILYLHDAGSRGDDNALHMCSMGASPLYPLLNADEDAIIIAPQVPKEELWITLPGNTSPGGFKFICQATKWLDGAVAKAKAVAAEYGIARENMYLVGSSNGAGAIWYLLNTDKPDFDRAAAIAGYGETEPDTDALIANVSKSHLWAFHGTADGTVVIDGMQVLAPKLTAAANGKFKYTEYEGATHATIYNLAAQTDGFADFFFKHENSDIKTIATEKGGMAVTANGGCINVTSDSPIDVFNAFGAKIGTAEKSASFSNLTAGLYIVASNGQAVKTIVK